MIVLGPMPCNFCKYTLQYSIVAVECFFSSIAGRVILCRISLTSNILHFAAILITVGIYSHRLAIHVTLGRSIVDYPFISISLKSDAHSQTEIKPNALVKCF